MVSQNINNQSLALPKDWCYYRFGNVAKVLRGGSPRPIQKYITRDINGVNWIKIGDTNINDMYINKTCEKITKSGAKYSRYVYIGDIILSNSMSFGRPYILNINGCIHDGWLVIQDYSETYDITFLYYALSSNIVKQQYIRLASGSGVKNLNKKTVSNTYIITPPKEEQVKIVNVLKNIDKLIYNLEILIKKKESIKQGFISNLLHITHYNKYKLCDIFLLSRGRVISQSEIKKNPGKYPVYSSQTTNNGVLGYINSYDYNGDVLTWTTDGANAGMVFVRTGKFNCTNVCGIAKLLNFNEFNLYYIATILNKVTKKYVSYVGNPKLMNNVFGQIIINLPDIKIQNIEAKKLINIDNEILILKNKLSKYRQIKQGIMEELLTGKKRL